MTPKLRVPEVDHRSFVGHARAQVPDPQRLLGRRNEMLILPRVAPWRDQENAVEPDLVSCKRPWVRRKKKKAECQSVLASWMIHASPCAPQLGARVELPLLDSSVGRTCVEEGATGVHLNGKDGARVPLVPRNLIPTLRVVERSQRVERACRMWRECGHKSECCSSSNMSGNDNEPSARRSPWSRMQEQLGVSRTTGE